MEKVYGHCRACHLSCPAYYNVEEGRIVSVEGVPLEEGGTGVLCGRGLATCLQIEYSPTRVRYPLKRAGKRGEGKWERISWDQAVSEIADKVVELSSEYGPETFAFPARTGRQDMGWIAHRIARTIGTPNNYYGAIQQCLLPQIHTCVNFGCMLNQSMGMDPAIKLWVSVGGELGYTEPILASLEGMNEQTGFAKITLDPVCGPQASRAEEWVPIRPGTDLAYFMGLIRYLIDTDTFDAQFVTEQTNAAFLVRLDTGALLTESDLKRNGSPDRYFVWDRTSGAARFWDSAEIQWEGGESGRSHYEACEDNFYHDIASKEPSPAVMPDGLSPALRGEYRIAVQRAEAPLVCKPAFQLLEEAVAEWVPEKVAAITGVPLDQVVRTYEMISQTRPVSFFEGAQYQATNASQFYNAFNICKMLTGSVGVPGGVDFAQFYPVMTQPFPGEFDICYADGLPLEQKRKRLGYYDRRIGCGFAWEEWSKWHPVRPENADATLNYPDIEAVLEAIETGDPYPVHGLFAISSNWLMHDGSTDRWLKVLEDEEKIQLHVVTDFVMTPTAELADYVIPAETWLERNYLEFKTMGAGAFKNAYRRAVEPLCEARHDYDFGAALAHKLEEHDARYNNGRLLNPVESRYWAGEYGKLWENDTIDEERDRWCKMFAGASWEECLDARKVEYPPESASQNGKLWLIAGKWPTGTGKAELFSTLYQHAGYPPLPVYTEPAESPLSRPDLADKYPLVFTNGKRQAGFFHSEFRQIPWLRELNPLPEVFVNPSTAREFGVGEGDWIWVESPTEKGREPHNKIMGKVSFRLMVRPGVVSYSQHAWWRPEKAADDELHGALEWNVEALLESKSRSPETGTIGLRSQLCTIYPCSEEEVERYRPMITREELEAFMPLERGELQDD